MTPQENAAKQAYDTMVGLFHRRAGTRPIASDAWEAQSQEVRDDWMAAVAAAVAETREAEFDACLDDITGLMGESRRPDTEAWNAPLAKALELMHKRHEVSGPQ